MDIWVQLGKDTSFSHMAFSLMASNKNDIDYIFVPNIPHIFGIEFFVFFHFQRPSSFRAGKTGRVKQDE